MVLVSNAGNSLSPAASLCCPFLRCERFLLKGFNLKPCELSRVEQSYLFRKPDAVDWNCFSLSWHVAGGRASSSSHRPPAPRCRLPSPAGKPVPGFFWGAGWKTNKKKEQMWHTQAAVWRGSILERKWGFNLLNTAWMKVKVWKGSLFPPGVCPQTYTQVTVPCSRKLVRGPGTDPLKPNECRGKSHREILVSFASSRLLYKLKSIKSGGRNPQTSCFSESKAALESSQIRKRIQKSRLVCLI